MANTSVALQFEKFADLGLFMFSYMAQGAVCLSSDMGDLLSSGFSLIICKHVNI